MDDDKNPAPQTTDAGQADQSAATATTDDINLDNVDPRLIVQDEPGDEPAPADEPPTGDEPPADQAVTPPPDNKPDKPDADGVKPPDAPADPQTTSRRENKRIATLTEKLKEAQLRQPQSSQPQQNNQIIGEGDYSTDQINGMAQNYGDKRYLDGVQQANNSTLFMTRLEVDAPKVEAKYPLLNPKGDDFDPGIADWSTQLFYKAVGLKAKADGTFTVENTNIRYEEFIDGLMEAVDKMATSKSADTQTSVTKQVAQLGVRPNNVAKKGYQGDDPNKMTLDQLRAKVNQELGIAS